ncbi:unnamed protein product [Effrenium voratum]|nr:unnamed protein product [Effrenium voratum]
MVARLLESGAQMRQRENLPEDMDDDAEVSFRFNVRFLQSSSDVETTPRSALDLLALNRFATPSSLSLAIKKAVEFKADPNHGVEKPLSLAVRARNTTAVRALLDAGASVDRQALSGLQLISEARCRREIEDRFLAAVTSGECPMKLKDASLWLLIQSGNVKAVKQRQRDMDEHVEAVCMVALRRCRDPAAKEELRRLLVERAGEAIVASAQAQAATLELVMELRESLLDEREPDQGLVQELVALGANTQARGLDLDNYDEGMESDDDETEEDSESDCYSDY